MTEPFATASAAAPPDALQVLIDELLRRHGSSVNGVLFYGSCLRSGDLFDSLVDLYLVVDNYRDFYGRGWQAIANWLLPPNVFYIEVPVDARVLRCKYAVISSRDFAAGSARWFQSYIWGRFTQPVKVVYARDTSARAALEYDLRQSARSFLQRVLPRLPATGDVRELWREGLRLSYGVELRAEKSGRSQELIDLAPDYYLGITRELAGALRYRLELCDDGERLCYRAQVPRWRRFLSRISWPLRQLQGKLLSIARLLKALFTFDGGLDYIAWKLERHSGQQIEIPERVRRYPLIFIWGLMIHLYRRGVFR